MGKLGLYGHICLVYCIAATLFLGFITYVLAFDPHRLHIIPVGAKPDERVTKAWTTCGIALLFYMITGGVLFYMKYAEMEASRDLDQFTEHQRGKEVAGADVREYQLREYHSVKQMD